MRPAFLLLLALTASQLVACAEFPELDGTIAPEQADAPFPDLIPLAGLTARADGLSRATAVTQTDVSARVAALNARAAQLRGPVIPTAVRARMVRGVR